LIYTVSIKKGVVKAIAELDAQYRKRVAQVLRSLVSDPRPPGCCPLKGFPNTWRIRVGDVRIIYEVYDDHLLVHVIRLGHRRDVYKKM
jgi:mRNA interferase RelE/StbE